MPGVCWECTGGLKCSRAVGEAEVGISVLCLPRSSQNAGRCLPIKLGMCWFLQGRHAVFGEYKCVQFCISLILSSNEKLIPHFLMLFKLLHYILWVDQTAHLDKLEVNICISTWKVAGAFSVRSGLVLVPNNIFTGANAILSGSAGLICAYWFCRAKSKVGNWKSSWGI